MKFKKIIFLASILQFSAIVHASGLKAQMLKDRNKPIARLNELDEREALLQQDPSANKANTHNRAISNKLADDKAPSGENPSLTTQQENASNQAIFDKLADDKAPRADNPSLTTQQENTRNQAISDKLANHTNASNNPDEMKTFETLFYNTTLYNNAGRAVQVQPLINGVDSGNPTVLGYNQTASIKLTALATAAVTYRISSKNNQGQDMRTEKIVSYDPTRYPFGYKVSVDATSMIATGITQNPNLATQQTNTRNQAIADKFTDDKNADNDPDEMKTFDTQFYNITLYNNAGRAVQIQPLINGVDSGNPTVLGYNQTASIKLTALATAAVTYRISSKNNQGQDMRTEKIVSYDPTTYPFGYKVSADATSMIATGITQNPSLATQQANSHDRAISDKLADDKADDEVATYFDYYTAARAMAIGDRLGDTWKREIIIKLPDYKATDLSSRFKQAQAHARAFVVTQAWTAQGSAADLKVSFADAQDNARAFVIAQAWATKNS